MTDAMNAPFQIAFNSSDPVFVYFSKHPEELAPFNDYMVYSKNGIPTWVSMVSSEEVENPKCSKEDVLFVDMGGNIGHRCAEIKAKYPQVQGKVVLQDLEYAITMAQKMEGMENTVHDFFTPQTVKNEGFYYISAVLYDWPDAKYQEILRNMIPAMGEDSVILLDEMVLPEWNVHWEEATQIGMTMMCFLTVREGTKGEWEELLGRVGLVIGGIWTYTPSV